MRSAGREIAAFSLRIAFLRSAARSPHHPAHSPGAISKRAELVRHRCHPSQRTRGQRRPETLQARRHPLAKLALVHHNVGSRTGKHRASARRCSKVSESPAPNSSRLSRSAPPCLFAPCGKFPCFRRVREISAAARRSSPPAATIEGELSCFRYGTLARAKRSGEVCSPFDKSRIMKLPSDLDIFSLRQQVLRMQPVRGERPFRWRLRL